MKIWKVGLQNCKNWPNLQGCSMFVPSLVRNIPKTKFHWSYIQDFCLIHFVDVYREIIFNNFVAKNRGRGSVKNPYLVTWLRIVHNCPLVEGGDQNLVKFGLRSFWMPLIPYFFTNGSFIFHFLYRELFDMRNRCLMLVNASRDLS